MKKIIITSMLLCGLCTTYAQEQVRIWKDGEGSSRFLTSELTFSEDGNNLSVADSTFDVSRIDSIAVVHTVNITFAGDTATVDLGHAPKVTYTVEGAHVNILSTNTKSELEFVLQGESTQGSLTYDGPLKCKFYLNGLNLKSNKGAAIDIQCGKRVDLILVDGTENFLADAAGGTHKAAFHCKGHVEVSGGGSLTVTGNTKHGIDTKEYLQIGKTTGSITVNKALGDALHVGQYFQMNGGKLTISGQEADGIQVETLTTVTEAGDTIPNPDKELNGLMFFKGGNINITANADLSRGIKAATDLIISGGVFVINAIGDGSKGIQVTRNMIVNQNDATTVMNIKATGSVYEDEITEDETYCYAIKIKGDFTFESGTIIVSNKGYGTRGCQYGGTYTKGASAVWSGSIKKK